MLSPVSPGSAAVAGARPPARSRTASARALVVDRRWIIVSSSLVRDAMRAAQGSWGPRLVAMPRPDRCARTWGTGTTGAPACQARPPGSRSHAGEDLLAEEAHRPEHVRRRHAREVEAHDQVRDAEPVPVPPAL